MHELSKHFEPAAVEPRHYDLWRERGLFHGEPARGGEPYVIVIPPPNVTGVLHMGHALNNTIQDVLIRSRRMRGAHALWVPGTDHAGIATQNVVERQCREEGRTRDSLGREAFLERVWAWRRQYGDTITRQLRRLGCACDWERERFTLDEGLSRAVREVFVRLYEKDLIYRGQYIINWCPRCRTALSDEESEHEPVDGHLYTIRYPLGGRKTKQDPRVATTRPETLFGDVALAVNPRDERYRALLGRRVRVPLTQRTIPVIADDFVDPAFGTGVVKVTPAHDPNDFEIGRRHDLEHIEAMNEDGTLNDAAGPYAGMERFECRRRLASDLKEAGLLEKEEPHRHAVGHCYRCHAMIEPRLSPQWFVRMRPLARPAIEAVRDGRIQFVPGRWTKVYLDWMENIRDWCISRQIWWGHRIPVYTCAACAQVWAAVDEPTACPRCAAGTFRQDEDVLDTWFSSWLWPFSVFGWPDGGEDLAFYYPTSTLVTAPEILFFWVARMVMAGLEFMGDIPFRSVYIHGTVRDDQGRKMSKSLGNAVDPLSVIDRYGADALRFSLMMLTATGQDVYISDSKFEVGRNFATKIWNAARYLQRHARGVLPEDLLDPVLDESLLTSDDRHILARWHDTVTACTNHLDRFRFNDAALSLYDFLWHQFCDWYVEYSKEPLYGAEGPRRDQVLKIMQSVFCGALRLLHPFMPFLTEELWQALGYRVHAASILEAPWPAPLPRARREAWGLDAVWVDYVDAKHDLVRVARLLMADYGLRPGSKITFLVHPAGVDAAERLAAEANGVAALLKVHAVRVCTGKEPEETMPSALSRLGTVSMPVKGLIDVAAEKARLARQRDTLQKDLDRVERKLGNEAFLHKAPAAVVDKQKNLLKDLRERRDKLEAMLSALG